MIIIFGGINRNCLLKSLQIKIQLFNAFLNVYCIRTNILDIFNVGGTKNNCQFNSIPTF